MLRADIDPSLVHWWLLFVGHVDFTYLHWQVLDTSGILSLLWDCQDTVSAASLTWHSSTCEGLCAQYEEATSSLQNIRPCDWGKWLWCGDNSELLEDSQKVLLDLQGDWHTPCAHTSSVTCDRGLAWGVEARMKGDRKSWRDCVFCATRC